VSRNRNTRGENDQIKESRAPDGWDDQSNMSWQKDVDIRGTNKHGKSYCGYKNPINIVKEHQLVQRYVVIGTSVNDSQIFDEVLLVRTKGKARAGRLKFLLRPQSTRETDRAAQSDEQSAETGSLIRLRSGQLGATSRTGRCPTGRHVFG